MRDFMPCKGCDEPEACEIEGRCLEPALTPPEFQEVSWGVDAVMRPVTGLGLSEFAFREWCNANGIALAGSAGNAGVPPQSTGDHHGA